MVAFRKCFRILLYLQLSSQNRFLLLKSSKLKKLSHKMNGMVFNGCKTKSQNHHRELGSSTIARVSKLDL